MFKPYEMERIARKSELINWLGWQRRVSRYLELATLTTGRQFASISPRVFSTIHRAMYRLPPNYDDGMPITFRTESGDSGEILGPLLERPERYDIIFVDPYHTYECSRQDLELALALLAPDGMLVVHDCHPTSLEIASPEFRRGQWLGVTYLAFLDLMRERPHLDYCVVDMDHGCGVVWRPAEATRQTSRSWLEAWDYHDWPVYFEHQNELLQLLGVDDFLARRRKRPPTVAASVYKKLKSLNQGGRASGIGSTRAARTRS